MTVRQFLRIVEIRTKIVSVSTFGLALLWVWVSRGGLDLGHAALMFAAVLCVDMGTTGFNSFYDYWKGVDSLETNREADKVLVHERVAPGAALLVSLGLYALAGLLGLVLAWLTTPWLLLWGALSLAVGFLYNGGPRPLSSTPLGELFAGGFLGGVLFLLTVLALGGDVSGLDAALALPSTLFIASILTVNNTCDRLGDTHAGRRTLTILIGDRASRVLIIALGYSAYAAAALILAFGAGWGAEGAVPFLAGAGLAVPDYAALEARGYSHETKGPSMGGISRLFVNFSLAFAAALVWQLLPF